MGAGCEGFAQSNGGVPESVHTHGTAGGCETRRLSVDGEQNVGVCKDAVVPLDQPRTVVRNNLTADVERVTCHRVGGDVVHDQERQRTHRDACQVGVGRQQIGGTVEHHLHHDETKRVVVGNGVGEIGKAFPVRNR